jgi:ubiquinone biosynthesis protein
MTSSAVGGAAVALRAVRVVGVLAGRSVELVLNRPARDVWLADTVVALGPAFVKAAQLLSTRADVLPVRVCRALSRLHDRVRPMPSASAAVLLSSRLGGGRPVLVGAGSIACVYRVALPDGREVAVKVRRPGIERSLCADLAMIERGARMLARLPVLRGVPVVEIAVQLTESVRRQLDFGREAESLDGFRLAMVDVPGVTVPSVDRRLSTEDMLVMEFVDGLARRAPEKRAGDRAASGGGDGIGRRTGCCSSTVWCTAICIPATSTFAGTVRS